MREKTDKLDDIKVRNFYLSKDTINRGKVGTEPEKLLATNIN